MMFVPDGKLPMDFHWDDRVYDVVFAASTPKFIDRVTSEQVLDPRQYAEMASMLAGFMARAFAKAKAEEKG